MKYLYIVLMFAVGFGGGMFLWHHKTQKPEALCPKGQIAVLVGSGRDATTGGYFAAYMCDTVKR